MYIQVFQIKPEGLHLEGGIKWDGVAAYLCYVQYIMYSMYRYMYVHKSSYVYCN